MDSNTTELTILLIGVATALSTFHHYFAAEGEKRKSPLFIFLLVLSIVTQLITQVWQYHNAVMTRREQDRRTSDALYAFNQTEERLLLKVADPRMSESNPYVIGYWYFKRGYGDYKRYHNSDLLTKDAGIAKKLAAAQKNLDQAKIYLDLAIHDGRFVPQSYYLLGTINRVTQLDWSEARKDFDKAIHEDQDYGAAYYGRAILRLQSKDLEGTLDDLEQATSVNVISCWDMRDPDEQCAVWKDIKDMDRYRKIANECGARFDLLPPAQDAPVKTHACLNAGATNNAQ
jgi:tetratricopeptide (TPR) repeat protein